METAGSLLARAMRAETLEEHEQLMLDVKKKTRESFEAEGIDIEIDDSAPSGAGEGV